MNQIGSNNDINCHTSQIFLHSTLSVRTKNGAFDPAGSLYDSRDIKVLFDPEKLEARQKRPKTALAVMNASQKDQPYDTRSAFALLNHDINLMFEMRGTSDQLLDKLAEKEGSCIW